MVSKPRAAALTLAAVVGVAILGVFLAPDGEAQPTQTAGHPLDPLTSDELQIVARTLVADELADGTALYPLVTLHEPPKEQVRRWTPGDPFGRSAFAIVKSGPDTFEAVIDLVAQEVRSWEQVEGVQPSLLPTAEFSLVQSIVRADADWQEAARRRGVDDFSDVVCVPNTAGYFGVDEQAGRRLTKAICYAPDGADNYWGRPIEGLIAVVDLDEREIIELIDTGAVPIPDAPVDLDRSSDAPEGTNPITVEQVGGPNFELDGNTVAWQGWRFHHRIDPRLGPVISLVTFDDDGERRSVLYQGSLSELFIPYMDPDVGWYFRTYLDAGEVGVGSLAVPLAEGLDCPGNAVFFDAVFADDTGRPRVAENASCLFERSAGGISWRHYEAVTGSTNVRPQIDLVYRSVSAIGNYDYIFDWVFRHDGTIGVDVGATGIPQVKGVENPTASGDSEPAYGHLVAEHTVAVNHDHFFAFRLDLDVDGVENTFVRDELTAEQQDTATGRQSVWVVESTTAETEQEAQTTIDIERPSVWRFVNENVVGPLGNPVGYQLETRSNAISLLTTDDLPQQRAGFTDHHLWVTPYDPDERYAAGTYPNQSTGGAGLPEWTEADRAIVDTDIVAWYTLGFHHAPRAEDWPVTPTIWHNFELRPFDFFERNPALDGADGG